MVLNCKVRVHDAAAGDDEDDDDVDLCYCCCCYYFRPKIFSGNMQGLLSSFFNGLI